jgi:hypothetical protein
MNILLAISLLLFDFNYASGNDFSKDQLEPFFYKLYDSFLFQSLYEPISEEIILKLTFFINHFPLDTLEAIKNINNREFSYFFGRLKIHSYIYGKSNPFSPYSRIVNIQEAFRIFHRILNQFLGCVKCERVPGYPQKVISLIISILKGINNSNRNIKVLFYNIDMISLSTKDYINHLILTLRYFNSDDDSLKGFETAFGLLRGLALKCESKFPVENFKKNQIYALLFICDYYSQRIYVQNIGSLDIEAVNPQVLAFFYRLREYFDRSEALFSLCASKNLAIVILNASKFYYFTEISRAYGNETRCRSLLSQILRETDSHQHLKLRIYLRLFFYYAHLRKIKNIIL